MALRSKVSDAVIRRLPGYHRHLEELEEEGVVRISSQELSERMGLTASQIRQDINCFGTLGQQGYGYNVSELRRHMADILGLNRPYHVIVVGAGNVGRAIASYAGFARLQFAVEALFDTDPALLGGRVLPLDSLEEYLGSHKVDIGVITTPSGAAQPIADRLMAGGVNALWNFAPVDIQVQPGCSVQNVQLTDSLLVLTYHMQDKML